MDSNPVRIEELLAHAGWVRKLAARLVRDSGTADDVTQEVWAYALRAPPRDRRNLRGWLAEVVHNAARSFGRSESRRAARENASTPLGTEEGTDELVERGQLHRQLVEQVMALEEPYRSIVLAHWFEGESMREIAGRQGLTPKMARTRLDAAHDRLRQRMDEAGGGRAAWSLAFVGWIEPRQAAAIGGTLVAKKIVLSGLAAGLLCFGWFAWPRAPVRRLDGAAADLRSPDSLSSPPSDVASTSRDPRRSGSRIVVVDECGHPLGNVRVTRDSTNGERLLGTTDDQGTLALAPEDASGPANILLDGFETARIPDLEVPELRVTLLDKFAITGLVKSDGVGFRPEALTVLALESLALDVAIAPDRLALAAARATPNADGTFRLVCLPPDRRFTIIAGGAGWVSRIPTMQGWPRVERGTRDVTLDAARLFAARLEFRDQDGDLARVLFPNYGSGQFTRHSTFPSCAGVEWPSAEHVLAGLPEAWIAPGPGICLSLFTSNAGVVEVGPNHLELQALGYDTLSLNYQAWSTSSAIETQTIQVRRIVGGFGTLRVRYLANGDQPAGPGQWAEGMLRAVPESGAPIEFGLRGTEPSVDVSNLPVGRYRFSFAPRMGTGTIPEDVEHTPWVRIDRGAIAEFDIPMDTFGSVRLTLLGESGAPYTGQFMYSLRPATRDPTTGTVTPAAGHTGMTISLTPPAKLPGLMAGTYILRCFQPRPLEPSHDASERDIVFDLQGGEEKALTVRLREP